MVYILISLSLVGPKLDTVGVGRMGKLTVSDQVLIILGLLPQRQS